MAEDVDVLVIGGGLAGITAALELQRVGRRVLLVEQASRLGGKAGSAHTAVGEFPTGPSSFNGRVPSFWRLLALLNMTDDDVVRLHPSSSARFVVRGGKLRGLKANPFSVLFTGALTLREKWALVSEFLFPRAAPVASGDESLHSLLVRRFGESVVEHFFSAVMTGIFAGDLKKLSAQACMPALVTAEKEYGSVLKGALRSMQKKVPGSQPGLYTLKGGFGVLGERAATLLPTRLAATVESLVVGRRGVTATVGETRINARAIVLATEADAASRLLSNSLPIASGLLGRFEYAPMTLVQWAERTPGESRLPLGFGYLTAPVEALFSLGALFIGDLRAESPRRFSSFVGGALQPERALRPDSELIEGVQGDLRSLTGGTLGEVVNVVRWPRAVFQPPIGHATRLQEISQALSEFPVALAGSYLGGAAMKDAIGSGFVAAERALEFTAVEPLRSAS